MAGWAATPGGTDVTVRLSQAGPYDNPDDWAKIDITSFVRKTEGLVIARGRSDEFSDFQAGSCQFTLNNNEREFDPSYAASPYFALLKPRSYVEVTTARAGTFLNLTGASGTRASTPDHAMLDITGDIDLRADVTPADWTPAASETLVSKWTETGNQDAYMFQITSGGLLRLLTSPNGTQASAILTDSTVAITPPESGRLALRVTLDVASGSDRVTKFYTGPTVIGPWTQLGATVTAAGTTSIFNSTAPLEVGASSVGTIERFTGQIHKVQVRDGIDGMMVANPDFTSQLDVGTTFTDDMDRVWTLHGAASFGLAAGIERKLFAGYVEGWPQEWTKTTGTVPIVAHDRLSILATDSAEIGIGAFILGDPVQGALGTGILGSSLPVQLSGERILELLSVGGYSGEFADVDLGLTYVIETATEGNILNLIQETANAEGGFFFTDRNGRFQFLDRHSRFLEHRLSTVQAMFTDSHYGDLKIDNNLSQVWNDARFERTVADGNLIVSTDGNQGDFTVETDAEVVSPQRASDGTSIRLYGRRVYSTQIPVASDAEALGRAQFWIRRFSTPRQRPDDITTELRRDLNMFYDHCVERELLDRVEITRTPLGIEPTVSIHGLLERIEHRITNVSWRVTFAISLIDPVEGATFMRLGDTTLGKLGTGELAY